MTDDKLSALWREADKGRELPEPALLRFTDNAPHYTADQMRAFAVPTPEALRRFAEAVAEEAVGRTAARCREMAMWPQGIDDEQAYYGRMFAEFIDREFGAAIRRHVKGE